MGKGGNKGKLAAVMAEVRAAERAKNLERIEIAPPKQIRITMTEHENWLVQEPKRSHPIWLPLHANTRGSGADTTRELWQAPVDCSGEFLRRCSRLLSRRGPEYSFHFRGRSRHFLAPRNALNAYPRDVSLSFSGRRSEADCCLRYDQARRS